MGHCILPLTMIDPKTEKLILLREAAGLAWLPRTYSYASLRSWALAGLKGVVLETLPVGGTRYTTEAAVLRFFERLQMGVGTTSVTGAEARAAHAAAVERLAAMGV